MHSQVSRAWQRLILGAVLVVLPFSLTPRAAVAIGLDQPNEQTQQLLRDLRVHWANYQQTYRAAFDDARMTGAPVSAATQIARDEARPILTTMGAIALQIANGSAWLARIIMAQFGSITAMGALFVILYALLGVEAAAAGVLLVELGIAGQYFDAVAVTAALDRQIRIIQDGVNSITVEGQGACCCLRLAGLTGDTRVTADGSGGSIVPRGHMADPKNWVPTYLDESPCRLQTATRFFGLTTDASRRYAPTQCHSRRPSAALTKFLGGVQQACAFNSARQSSGGHTTPITPVNRIDRDYLESQSGSSLNPFVRRPVDRFVR